ncbi:MAG: helix-turn-helix transcriptional regulator [Nitrososphaerota archaeon]|jgi:hypothetical protein|nr:helix-turn-helix transcriptional regulator [Nitrososphaerota archaeon]MDG6948879.1 helix-turn-helix transcriptional regulator [Nitrososphaerota archaeon]
MTNLDDWAPRIDKVGPDYDEIMATTFPEVRVLFRIYALRPEPTTYSNLGLFFHWSKTRTDYFDKLSLTTVLKRLLKHGLIEATSKTGPRMRKTKKYALTQRGYYVVESMLKTAHWNEGFRETIPK